RRHTRFSRDWSSDVFSSDLISLKQVETTALFCPSCHRQKISPPYNYNIPSWLLVFLNKYYDLQRGSMVCPSPIISNRQSKVKQEPKIKPDYFCNEISEDRKSTRLNSSHVKS